MFFKFQSWVCSESPYTKYPKQFKLYFLNTLQTVVIASRRSATLEWNCFFFIMAVLRRLVRRIARELIRGVKSSPIDASTLYLVTLIFIAFVAILMLMVKINQNFSIAYYSKTFRSVLFLRRGLSIFGVKTRDPSLQLLHYLQWHYHWLCVSMSVVLVVYHKQREF